jgi:diaminobutyrate-2-oxoglutarate transaminase
MNLFEETESQVRYYSRHWPVVFERAFESRLYDESGRSFIDFFAGAGALNYGHNHPVLKAALIDFLQADGLIQSLDMWTVPRSEFLRVLRDIVLIPRGLDHKVQFPGPAGTTAVEAAIKLARKVTGRNTVVGFTGGFHGMTLGSQSIIGGSDSEMGGSGTRAGFARPLPYCTQSTYKSGFDTVDRLLGGSSTSIKPAAVIVEVVQGEGGINIAATEWLRSLSEVCRSRNIIFIVDDVQMGCGRTGPFFSFERAGLRPDIICLSKSISAYGLPLALTLVRPDLDTWKPGEHSGTFRGFTPAFVTASKGLTLFWSDDTLARSTSAKSEIISRALLKISSDYHELGVTIRGCGLAFGVEFRTAEVASAVAQESFACGLLVETAGALGNVVKFLPPLTISADDLTEGLSIFQKAVSVASRNTKIEVPQMRCKDDGSFS